MLETHRSFNAACQHLDEVVVSRLVSMVPESVPIACRYCCLQIVAENLTDNQNKHCYCRYEGQMQSHGICMQSACMDLSGQLAQQLTHKLMVQV